MYEGWLYEGWLYKDSLGKGVKEVINPALISTFSRTIITSLTLFLVVVILFIFGGEVLRGFSLAMIIGVAFGTYSSLFIAAPIVVDTTRDEKKPVAAPQPAAQKVR